MKSNKWHPIIFQVATQSTSKLSLLNHRNTDDFNARAKRTVSTDTENRHHLTLMTQSRETRTSTMNNALCGSVSTHAGPTLLHVSRLRSTIKRKGGHWKTRAQWLPVALGSVEQDLSGPPKPLIADVAGTKASTHTRKCIVCFHLNF